MARNTYSDNVKSLIGGAIFTLVVLGSVGYNEYIASRKAEVYQRLDKTISGFDGKPQTTSLRDWMAAYEKGLGRELSIGENPLSLSLSELETMDGKLKDITSVIYADHVK